MTDEEPVRILQEESDEEAIDDNDKSKKESC
jgi:hypothetical protein